MKTVLITGGSGYIGRRLTFLLQKNGYNVAWLTRKADTSSSIKQYEWNYKERKIDPEAIQDADAIVHLAGAPINGRRWNEAYKKEIYESRILSTEFLFETTSLYPHKIKAFVSSSGTGYYGISTSKNVLKETDSPGTDFLGRTCFDWEKASNSFSKTGIRTVIIRSGIVFSQESEALKNISFPIRFHMGPILGSGYQYFPWIHLDDLCQIYFQSISDERMTGVYNAVAPEYLTYRQILKIISDYFRISMWQIKIPSFLLKIIKGEITSVLLNGSRISSEKITKSEFKFKYPSLENSMAQLFPSTKKN